VNTSGS